MQESYGNHVYSSSVTHIAKTVNEMKNMDCLVNCCSEDIGQTQRSKSVLLCVCVSVCVSVCVCVHSEVQSSQEALTYSRVILAATSIHVKRHF